MPGEGPFHLPGKTPKPQIRIDLLLRSRRTTRSLGWDFLFLYTPTTTHPIICKTIWLPLPSHIPFLSTGIFPLFFGLQRLPLDSRTNSHWGVSTFLEKYSYLLPLVLPEIEVPWGWIHLPPLALFTEKIWTRELLFFRSSFWFMYLCGDLPIRTHLQLLLVRQKDYPPVFLVRSFLPLGLCFPFRQCGFPWFKWLKKGTFP